MLVGHRRSNIARLVRSLIFHVPLLLVLRGPWFRFLDAVFAKPSPNMVGITLVLEVRKILSRFKRVGQWGQRHLPDVVASPPSALKGA